MALSAIEMFFHQVALGEDQEQLKNVVNAKDQGDEEKTPLHKASKKGNLQIVKALVLLGAEMEANDEDGNTPLILAANEGNTDVVKYLIEIGAQIEAKDNDGQTPLHCADNAEVAKCLIQKGANIEAKDDEARADGNRTPLHVASHNGRTDVVKCLIEMGAQIEAKDNDGNTALHCVLSMLKLQNVLFKKELT